jgi:hypothetical protein
MFFSFDIVWGKFPDTISPSEDNVAIWVIVFPENSHSRQKLSYTFLGTSNLMDGGYSSMGVGYRWYGETK